MASLYIGINSVLVPQRLRKGSKKGVRRLYCRLLVQKERDAVGISWHMSEEQEQLV